MKRLCVKYEHLLSRWIYLKYYYIIIYRETYRVQTRNEAKNVEFVYMVYLAREKFFIEGY